MFFVSTFGNGCWAIGVIFCPLELIILGFGIIIRITTVMKSCKWRDTEYDDVEISDTDDAIVRNPLEPDANKP